MRRLASWATLALTVTLAVRAHAQRAAAAVAPATSSASQHHLDFLLGEWKLEASPKVNALAAKIHGTPKFPGTWKAWRTLEGRGVTDELRLLDPSGNPRTSLTALRAWDEATGRWKLWAVDAWTASATLGDGAGDGTTFTFTSSGTDGDGKVFRTRATFSDITPTSFRYRLDRSYDLGKTWTEGVLVIVATRTAPAGTR